MAISRNIRSYEEIIADRKKIKKEIKSIDARIKEIINSSSIELTATQREQYENLNKAIKENKKNERKIFKPYKDEKDYLVVQLNISKNFKESSLIRLTCEEKGHISKGGIIVNGTYISAYCKRCGMLYQRSLSKEERRDYNESMNTPMSI